jgi:putative PIG3 family NAD(P)H quinone oxidoreductase
MRVLEAFPDGDGYRCVLADAERPTPAPGEVLVQVDASGLNRADLSQIAGRYPAPPGEPDTLGMELSGTIVGSGERICALVAGGAHAEYAAVPEGQILRVPPSTTLRDAAAIPEAFLTAFLNLAVEGGLDRGGRALVHAGASGVGLAAIQTARWLGASVAATTRSASKVEAMRKAGADPAIDTAAERFEEAIARTWGRESVDLILDPVGAATLAGDLDVLALGGRIVFLATLSGARAELDIGRLMVRRVRIIGSTLRSRSRDDKARLVERFRAEILPGFEAGALRVEIDSVYPASRAGEAFSRMRRNENVGKILLDWTSVGGSG